VSEAEVEVQSLTVDEELQPIGSNAVISMETEAARVTQEQVTREAARSVGLDPASTSDLRRAVEGVEVNIRPNT
jgi:hypothetical protein